MSTAAARTLLVRAGVRAQWGRCLVVATRRGAPLAVASGAWGPEVRARGFARSAGRLDGERKEDREVSGEEEGSASASESGSTAASEASGSESGSAGEETAASSVDGDGWSAFAEEKGRDAAEPEISTGVAGAFAVDDWDAMLSSTDAKQSASKGQPVDFAFAFDIDGVLLHKSTPIPGAIETLKFLQDRHIPFILLTNGGGKSEVVRITQLHNTLGVRLSMTNFVQSHTPFRGLASPDVSNDPVQRVSGVPAYLAGEIGLQNGLAESTILVTGSHAERARDIALSYGFKSVVTPADILKAKPEIFAFEHTRFYDQQQPRALPKPIYDPNDATMKLEDCLKIDAILVFNDPRDWAVDIQLITDLLLSHRGYLGTHSAKNGVDGLWQNDGQPALIYSNSDLLWSTGYPLPRFGQGAFQAAVKGTWHQIVAEAAGSRSRATAELKTFEYGKPHKVTYFYAQKKLVDYFFRERQRAGVCSPVPRLRNIYMVGDNPESDIRGAARWRGALTAATTWKQKKAGQRPLAWQACLVRTGVWSEAKTPLAVLAARKALPDTVQEDVKAVVNWALERECWPERVE